MSGKLTTAHRENIVLEYLASKEDGYYSHFQDISDFTELARAEVRLACRSLRRKGMAEFKTGLWTDDGEMAGAGYGITPAGRLALNPNGEGK